MTIPRNDISLDAALGYAAKGWACFPLSGKFPAIAKEHDGHGYLDASENPRTIRQWWVIYTHANIGIATRASGLLVLDVDVMAEMRVSARMKRSMARSQIRQESLLAVVGGISISRFLATTRSRANRALLAMALTCPTTSLPRRPFTRPPAKPTPGTPEDTRTISRLRWPLIGFWI